MTNAFSDIERLAIHTTDGLGLRAEVLAVDSEGETRSRALAVICHPHPLHGGNMHNHVVGGLFTALPAAGVPSMRFNFRGTSGSEGRHGGGVTEQLDIVAAINALTARFDANHGALPLLLIGYSFGGRIALAVDHPAVSAWLAIAPPLSMSNSDNLVAADDARPKVIVAGTADNFCSAADVEQLTSGWTSTRVVSLAGEDHFLATASGRLRAEALHLVENLSGV